jgi:hypothetical protein
MTPPVPGASRWAAWAPPQMGDAAVAAGSAGWPVCEMPSVPSSSPRGRSFTDVCLRLETRTLASSMSMRMWFWIWRTISLYRRLGERVEEAVLSNHGGIAGQISNPLLRIRPCAVSVKNCRDNCGPPMIALHLTRSAPPKWWRAAYSMADAHLIRSRGFPGHVGRAPLPFDHGARTREGCRHVGA